MYYENKRSGVADDDYRLAFLTRLLDAFARADD